MSLVLAGQTHTRTGMPSLVTASQCRPAASDRSAADASNQRSVRRSGGSRRLSLRCAAGSRPAPGHPRNQRDVENVPSEDTIERSFCELGACEHDVDVADDHSIEHVHGLCRELRLRTRDPGYGARGAGRVPAGRGERSRNWRRAPGEARSRWMCPIGRPSAQGIGDPPATTPHPGGANADATLRAMGSDESQMTGQQASAGPHHDRDSCLDNGIAAAYLELLKRSLTATVHQDVYTCPTTFDRPNLRRTPWTPRRWVAYLAASMVRMPQWELVRRCDHSALEQGRAWPVVGETMVGKARLDNLQHCIEDVVRQGVPGDYIETGVWRGGASIFARGVMKALGVDDRRVWVADSFAGLPPPDGRYEADANDVTYSIRELAIPLEVVTENFRRYGLLDDQVRFLAGWFRDTLPTLTEQSWAVLRLDGDMYGSTMDALENLYPRLSPGGYVIIDDGALPACRAAVDDFRSRHDIQDPIEPIDWTGCFWQRGSARVE